ncbi:MAG: hypothetical protein ACT4O1_07155 [Gemmatimonadota bacterium]
MWDSSIGIEETADVINVAPIVTVDFDGGFLVADAREAQLRKYSREGKLLWHFGGKGAGPAEFQMPRGIIRLTSGKLVAADLNNKLVVIDADGQKLRKSLQIPLQHIQDIEAIDDTLILISGMRGSEFKGPRIHVYNIRSGTIVRSFFEPGKAARNEVAAIVGGWVKLSIRKDTVAAVFSLADTIFLHNTQGALLRRIPIKSRGFRHVPPEPSNAKNAMQRAEWLSSFDYMADVHQLDTGGFIVAYMSLAPEAALEQTWHVIRLGPEHHVLAEIRDLPKLLTVDRQSGSLYFVAPDAEVPNRWAKASIAY